MGNCWSCPGRTDRQEESVQFERHRHTTQAHRRRTKIFQSKKQIFGDEPVPEHQPTPPQTTGAEVRGVKVRSSDEPIIDEVLGDQSTRSTLSGPHASTSQTMRGESSLVKVN